ncbi:DUF962 domain-containing protein [Acinetobacter puyangensis]|nr:DUF962 domain-containing protein [Acinetobacter puyangensis]
MDLQPTNTALPVAIDRPRLTMPIKNYQDFYGFYLTEHHDLKCRRLHFLGSSLGLLALITAVVKKQKRYVGYGLLAGYACAWVGHFVFEKNKPASFKQPLYSFISDWRMYYHIVTGQISLFDHAKDRFPH